MTVLRLILYPLSFVAIVAFAADVKLPQPPKPNSFVQSVERKKALKAEQIQQKKAAAQARKLK